MRNSRRSYFRFSVHEDQAQFFLPPIYPLGQANPSLVNVDDKMKISHNHYSSHLYLLRLYDAVGDPECSAEISIDMVMDHFASGLILLGSACQSLAASRQHTFEEVVDINLTPSKRILLPLANCLATLIFDEEHRGDGEG